MKFCVPETSVTLVADREVEEKTMEINNTGGGTSREQKAHVFGQASIKQC